MSAIGAHERFDERSNKIAHDRSENRSRKERPYLTLSPIFIPNFCIKDPGVEVEK